jgi:TPR repeat protein
MLARYCSPACQKKHWPTHKKECKQRAAELRDEALFKDPPAMEDCPICFLPMPDKLLCCMMLPPATISSVPIFDYAIAHVHLADMGTKQYYTCCGKSVCGGCLYSFGKSGNGGTCPFCKTERSGKTDEEKIEELLKRVEANDAGAIYLLGNDYYQGGLGLLQDRERTLELWKQAVKLGSSQAHFQLGSIYHKGVEMKKAKFHFEAAAMARHDSARYLLGDMDFLSGKNKEAVKHWKIAASAGHFHAMQLACCIEKRCG